VLMVCCHMREFWKPSERGVTTQFSFNVYTDFLCIFK
jgi:hypothetical protein